MNRSTSPRAGFTIVELLVVIVIIGILAAVTIVAFNGVQQRASNTSRIQAANQVIKLVKLYQFENSRYPNTSAVCATVDNQCSNYAGVSITTDNTNTLNNLRTFGQPPQSVPRQAGNYYGITLDIYSPRTIYGDPARDMLLMYWLEGEGQDCKNEVVRDTGGNVFEASLNPYTSTGSGKTTCWVGI